MSKISVKNLHFSYTDKEEIIKGINLELDQRSTAIIGQNGAGKTTFVKLLKGLLKPSSGDILLDGTSVRGMTAAQLSKHIGLVFQNPDDQIFKSKVIDEVMFGPLNIKQSHAEARENSIAALKAAGLADKMEYNPYDLSLSDRKLTAIASIVAMNTEIIIFDEPTIAQDYAGRERIKNIMGSLKEAGKLVMTIIHDMDFVAENFERTIVLNQGQVLIDGNTRDVFSNPGLLAKAHLELPHVTQLGVKLGCDRAILSMKELIDYASTK